MCFINVYYAAQSSSSVSPKKDVLPIMEHANAINSASNGSESTGIKSGKRKHKGIRKAEKI